MANPLHKHTTSPAQLACLTAANTGTSPYGAYHRAQAQAHPRHTLEAHPS